MSRRRQERSARAWHRAAARGRRLLTVALAAAQRRRLLTAALAAARGRQLLTVALAAARGRRLLTAALAAARGRRLLAAALAAARGRQLLAAALAAASLAGAAAAQDRGRAPVTLIADRVEILQDGRLVAAGNVEVLQAETRITAGRIVYDPDGERLQIEGPVEIVRADGTVLTAEAADLTTDLRDGLIRSARLVLGRELQLAATEITRVDGRYSRLTRTVASSCEVCAARPIPLWQIRAEAITHDEETRQLYFDNARFEVLGLPVLWVPRLRLPDPTLERATGFLTPSIRSTDELGFGIKVPYFIRLGDTRDLTLTPYLANNRTATLEYRYRQAFARGDIEVTGAVSQDDIRPDGLRGYLFATGRFDLPRNLRLSFDLKSTSDDAYLFDYDYSGDDRLPSVLSLTQIERDRFLSAELIGYRSLRQGEDTDTAPFLVSDVAWARSFVPPALGGIAEIRGESHGHIRPSEVDGAGRDVARLTLLGDWRRRWTAPLGLVLGLRGQLRLDHTVVADDSRFDARVTEITPTGLAEMRWPWVARAGGVTHLVEPVAQLVWSPVDSEPGPRDESTQLELDEGNLFALSRFPAGDELERGLRANLGLGYTRIDPSGWQVALSLGRIYRDDQQRQFAGFDILEGRESHWLSSARLDLPERLSLSNRTLFDNNWAATRNDLRLDWTEPHYEIAGTYTWLAASPGESRTQDTNEWRLDGTWQIDDHWRAATDLRYDLQLNRSAEARLGVEYRTECVRLDMSVRRRFTSSEDLRPTTVFGFEVALEGFGAGSGGRKPAPSPSCRG